MRSRGLGSHVVLHGLEHDAVLVRGVGHLHTAGAPNGGVRDITVAADLW